MGDAIAAPSVNVRDKSPKFFESPSVAIVMYEIVFTVDGAPPARIPRIAFDETCIPAFVP